MLGQHMVLRPRRAPEVVERKAEATIDIGLDRVLRVAIGLQVLSSRERAELGRRAVLVGAADEQDFVADLAAKAGVHVGRQQRTDEVAEVLDAIDVGQGTGDQNPVAHGSRPSLETRRTPTNEKPSRGGGRARVSAPASREWTRVNPSGRTCCGRADAFASHRQRTVGS